MEKYCLKNSQARYLLAIHLKILSVSSHSEGVMDSGQ